MTLGSEEAGATIPKGVDKIRGGDGNLWAVRKGRSVRDRGGEVLDRQLVAGANPRLERRMHGEDGDDGSRRRKAELDIKL